MTKTTSKPLTDLERLAIVGLMARERELQAALRTEYLMVTAAIEERLGMKAGAIGTTHTVNADAGEVVPTPNGNASAAARPAA